MALQRTESGNGVADGSGGLLRVKQVRART